MPLAAEPAWVRRFHKPAWVRFGMERHARFGRIERGQVSAKANQRCAFESRFELKNLSRHVQSLSVAE